MLLLSCFGQSNHDISSVKTFYIFSRCTQTKLVQVGRGSVLYSDFCPRTVLVPTMLYLHLLGPTHLPTRSPCPVCAQVRFQPRARCWSPKHSPLLLQTSSAAWGPAQRCSLSQALPPEPRLSKLARNSGFTLGIVPALSKQQVNERQSHGELKS